jgi:thioredoxin reductase (NADPH)
MNHTTKILILGSGSAGCTAAIYAARAGLSPIMLHGGQAGGQLTITNDIENFPGFEHPVGGTWLMEQMEKQAANVGATIIHDTIKLVNFLQRPFVAIGESGDSYFCDALIIATGATARWLGIPSEQKFSGYGVSACATCDGFFYKNKEVVVIGGGNSAVEEALYLANIAAKVTLIHRRDSLRAEKIGQERLFAHPKISVIWDSAVEEFLGTEEPTSLNAVRLKNLKTGEFSELKTDGAFVAIGHSPNTELFKEFITLDSEGYIETIAGSTKTNIQGVFAAGDVQDKIFRQAITAAGTGCMAALEAEKFISGH